MNEQYEETREDLIQQLTDLALSQSEEDEDLESDIENVCEELKNLCGSLIEANVSSDLLLSLEEFNLNDDLMDEIGEAIDELE